MLPLWRMNYREMASAFARLGKAFGDSGNIALHQAKKAAHIENLWFDENSIDQALSAWQELLTEKTVLSWAERDNVQVPKNRKKVGLIAAGNIPLVGLHDLLSVLLAGQRVWIKLSKDDRTLMQFAIDQLKSYDSRFTDLINVTERLNGIDALIATGSNNTSRYFDYYFRDIPRIIRKNRNSLAVLTGTEDEQDFLELGKDIFSYYGLGCRNVTHLLFPKGTTPIPFYDAIAPFYEVLNHTKYANNYTYHRALFLLNKQEHLDNNFLLLKEDRQLYSPVGCLNYSYYSSEAELKAYVTEHIDQIQVIVSKGGFAFPTLPLGTSQMPGLTDYADGVNTLSFLKELDTPL